MHFRISNFSSSLILNQSSHKLVEFVGKLCIDCVNAQLGAHLGARLHQAQPEVTRSDLPPLSPRGSSSAHQTLQSREVSLQWSSGLNDSSMTEARLVAKGSRSLAALSLSVKSSMMKEMESHQQQNQVMNQIMYHNHIMSSYQAY